MAKDPHQKPTPGSWLTPSLTWPPKHAVATFKKGLLPLKKWVGVGQEFVVDVRYRQGAEAALVESGELFQAKSDDASNWKLKITLEQ